MLATYWPIQRAVRAHPALDAGHTVLGLDRAVVVKDQPLPQRDAALGIVGIERMALRQLRRSGELCHAEQRVVDHVTVFTRDNVGSSPHGIEIVQRARGHVFQDIGAGLCGSRPAHGDKGCRGCGSQKKRTPFHRMTSLNRLWNFAVRRLFSGVCRVAGRRMRPRYGPTAG